MTVDIDERKLRGSEFILWLSWTLATALGMLLGYLPLALVVGPLDLGLVRVIVPIVAGLLLGLAQWLVLRPYVATSYDWIINQAAGWVVGFALGLFAVQLLAQTAIGTLAGFILFGAIVSLFQWPVLRREMPQLLPWLLANVVGWTLGAFLSQAAASLLFQNNLPSTFTSVVVTVGITGLALVWIVRQPDRPVAMPGAQVKRPTNAT